MSKMSTLKEKSVHAGVYYVTDDVTVQNYDIYLGDEIDTDEGDYRQLFNVFDHVIKEYDNVYLHLGNCGGECHTGYRLINHIKRCAAKVQVLVEAPCYSMGAVLALSGVSLTMSPGTFLMFHNYSGGSYGKGQELVQAAEETRKHLAANHKRICAPFLTTRELNMISKDQDFYIHPTDKDFKERIKRHFGSKK